MRQENTQWKSGSSWSRPSEVAETPELDVTPIMNMMVILIPFLVSMAVFTHYSSLQFSLPSSAGVGTGGPSKKDLKLTLLVEEASVDATLGDSILVEGISLEELGGVLKEIRPDLKRKEDVVLALSDKVKFDKVVDVMDLCRISGFEKVALSESAKDAAMKGGSL